MRRSLLRDIRGTEVKIIARLANDHEIHPNDLMSCIRMALDDGESTYEDFHVKCRHRLEGYATFLIECNHSFVAQIRLRETFVRNSPELTFKQFHKWIPFKHDKVDHHKRQGNLEIRDLWVGAKNVSLKANVIKKSATHAVSSKFNAQPLAVCNAIITDGTGSIKLSLWNEQIKTISVGDTIQIENGFVKSFRGERHLLISRHGKIGIIK